MRHRNSSEHDKAYRDAHFDKIKLKLKAWKASNPELSYFHSKATSLKRKTKNSDITGGQLRELYKRQNGLCALTGRKLLIAAKNHHPDCLSVDRIKPGQPYSISNVRLVTWQVNSARGVWSDADLLSLCEDVIRTLRLKSLCPDQVKTH